MTSRTKRLHTKPFPYQRKGVHRMKGFRGRVLLADDMGLGKSLQSLLYANGLSADAPTIIVCPAFLKWNWETEAWQHLGLRCHVIEGRRVRKFKVRHPIIIINYDILGDWLPFLLSLFPKLVIVDECHKIGNPRTKQTQNTRKLCRRSKRVICISGTPLLNRPSELFPVLNILRPDVFPSFHAYAERYCNPTWKPWGWDYKGATHLNELHRKLRRTCMIRRQKHKVLKELPRKQRTVVPLDIKNRKEYLEALHDFIGWLSKKSPRLANKARKAQQLVKIGYLKRLVARLKMSRVIEWIESFLAESTEKLLVFGVHKDILTQLEEHFGNLAVKVDGSVTGRQRQRLFQKFNTDKQTRLLLGNMKAAGVGWSCSSSSATAFIEFGWTPGEHTQAEDRTHGIKRGRAGFVTRSYYLVGRDTIEEDLCKLLQTKQQTLDGTLDGIESSHSLDIFDQLIRTLKRAAV